jgi:hypothetical protein
VKNVVARRIVENLAWTSPRTVVEVFVKGETLGEGNSRWVEA